MSTPHPDWVRGCVHGAASQLGLGPESYERLEQLYQDHHSEMLELVGSDQIWRRLAELYTERQGDQLGLGL